MLVCVCVLVFFMYLSNKSSVTRATTSGCTRQSSRSLVVMVLLPASLRSSAEFSGDPSAQSRGLVRDKAPPLSGLLLSGGAPRGQRTGVRWGLKGSVKEPGFSRVWPLESRFAGRPSLLLFRVWTFWKAPTARFRYRMFSSWDVIPSCRQTAKLVLILKTT